jgi:hypothetical protein
VIQALTHWAAESFHLVEAHAIDVGITGRPGGPVSVLGLDARLYLALLEAVVRRAPHHAQTLDDLYAASAPPSPQSAAARRAERHNEIQRISRLFGG